MKHQPCLVPQHLRRSHNRSRTDLSTTVPIQLIDFVPFGILLVYRLLITLFILPEATINMAISSGLALLLAASAALQPVAARPSSKSKLLCGRVRSHTSWLYFEAHGGYCHVVSFLT